MVKKEKKVYFYDWVIVKDEAARFENYVALELQSRIDLWNDMVENNNFYTVLASRFFG